MISRLKTEKDFLNQTLQNNKWKIKDILQRSLTTELMHINQKIQYLSV